MLPPTYLKSLTGFIPIAKKSIPNLFMNTDAKIVVRLSWQQVFWPLIKFVYLYLRDNQLTVK